MKFEDIIRLISEDFTAAWNNWDIDKMMSFVSNQVLVRSPKIKLVYPEMTVAELVGKEALKEYWIKLKEMVGDYQVEQLNITKQGREVNTVNKVINQDIFIYEKIVLDEYGKIILLAYEYQHF